MPPLCHWCQQYHCVIRKQSANHTRYEALCSVCYRLYQSGNYGYPRALRPLSGQRQPKIDFHQAPVMRNAKTWGQCPEVKTRVNELGYHPEKGIVLQLVRKKQTEITAVQLWALLTELNIYLTAQEAGEILRDFNGRTEEFRFCHAVGCRVIDWWNLNQTQHGIAACYYYPSDTPLPNQLSEIQLPRGHPYQARDLE